jgi:SAM-dependent methyltransferase
MPTIEPHEVREVAESFGADAERYDRARPSYPDEVITRITAALPGPDVVDVGCGTGISTRQFRAAGCRVLGVEPDARMAEVARRQGLDVEVAGFEDWDPEGRAFDGVVAGQAWHWVDPVAGAAKAAAALRPGGRLAAFWNVFEPPPAVAAAVAEVYARVVPGLPAFRPGTSSLDVYAPMFTAAADGIRQARAFGEPAEWRVEWDRHYTRDEWLDQVPTYGGNSRLPAARLAELLDATGAAIDALGGGFTMRYTTVVVTAATHG